MEADVEKYVHEGRIAEVAAYCETDVVNTYHVWLRYELFRGDYPRTACARAKVIWASTYAPAATPSRISLMFKLRKISRRLNLAPMQ